MDRAVCLKGRWLDAALGPSADEAWRELELEIASAPMVGGTPTKMVESALKVGRASRPTIFKILVGFLVLGLFLFSIAGRPDEARINLPLFLLAVVVAVTAAKYF